MYRIVIIGCGRIAKNHTAAATALPDVRIVGVCDHTPEKAADMAAGFEGCAAFTDAEEMLLSLRPDAAILCVPTFVHEQYVALCAKHGVNVLCEKPLERFVEPCRRLIAAAKDSGIVFMTAQVVRFWPGYVEIKELLDRGELGDVYMMRFRRVTSKDDAIAKWLNIPRLGGGAIHDMLVHDVDYLRYIAGPFESCYANATKDETGCYNNVLANIVCKNGVHAMAEASFTMQTGYPFSFSVSIIGSKATLEYDYSAGIRIGDDVKPRCEMKIWREGKGLEILEPPQEDAFARQLRYFLSCVGEGKQPTLITPEQSFEVICAIDALHESARTGNVIRLDEYEK